MNKTFIKQWMSGLHSLNKTEGICAFPNKYVHVTTNNCESALFINTDNILTIPFELIMLNLIKHISCAQRIWHQVTQRTVFSAYPGGRVPPHRHQMVAFGKSLSAPSCLRYNTNEPLGAKPFTHWHHANTVWGKEQLMISSLEQSPLNLLLTSACRE